MSDTETWAIDDDGEQIPGTGSRWVGPERCEQEHFMGGQCIHEWGHEGECHCYSDYGSLGHWNGGKGVLPGSIPPGHGEYTDPIDMHPWTDIGLGSWEAIEDA